MIWLLLLALIAVAVMQYWQINAVQGDLEQARAELRAAKKALGVVTGEVSATGANLNKSDSAIRSELETVNSEIRKLWDLANKRNRKSISANEQHINKLEKEVGKVSGQAGKAVAEASGIKARAEELNQLLKALTSEQLAASSEVAASFEKYRKQLEGLSAEQKKLIKRQAEAEKSMDAFRLRVNRQLLQLETSFRELTQSSEAGLKFEK
ncbi:hypothetical protein [Endozoicomonas sp. Mp262]|uniref:hypothetical protein n=1 Tax=Endozoicomonas sp. Mp262 TaxID=2919499 RepID=UPI0021E0A9A5